MTLEGKKIPYKKLDIAADESLKTKMREIAGNPKALPPQLANGDQYCGVSFMAVVLIHLQALSPSCSILHSEKWELEGLVWDTKRRYQVDWALGGMNFNFIHMHAKHKF